MFFTLTSSYYTGRYVMKSDWRVYGKKADFKRLADKYSIDQGYSKNNKKQRYMW